MARDQRVDNDGRGSRKLLNMDRIAQYLVIFLVTGGVSVGGIQFVKQGTVDTLATLKTEHLLLKQQMNHIKDLDTLGDESVQKQINSIQKELSEFKEDQKATNVEMMKKLEEILKESKKK